MKRMFEQRQGSVASSHSSFDGACALCEGPGPLLVTSTVLLWHSSVGLHAPIGTPHLMLLSLVGPSQWL